MKIGIIGGGVVGRATARTFMEHVDEVRVYDDMKERRTHKWSEVVYGCEPIFICVPETSVEALFRSMSPFDLAGGKFVLKSTVPIGTTRRLSEQYGASNLVHCPEFLTERVAECDAQMPARVIIGVTDGLSEAGATSHWLVSLFLRRFPGVPIHVLFSDASEALKLAQNAFFATKVAFFNELHGLCRAYSLDYNAIVAGLCADGRISHSHVTVPGPDGLYGFGGKCLPKDLAQYVEALRYKGCHRHVSEAAQRWARDSRGRIDHAGPGEQEESK